VIIPRRRKLAGHKVCIGKKRNAYKVSVVNPEGKRQLGRCQHRFPSMPT
jgi:hypothetical protein